MSHFYIQPSDSSSTTIPIPVPDGSSSFPTFQKPTIIGSFGQEPDQKWIEDASQYLKTYNPNQWRSRSLKKKPLDLNRGRVILKDFNSINIKGITPMLEWLHRHPLDTPPDFVLFRGAMTMIMKTPYESREPWSYSVIKYKETIYLKAEETEYARRQKFMISPFVEKTMRWGFKFEDYMTAGAESDLDEVLNTFEEFDVMYKSVLGDMSIVYGAEMDAVLEGSRKPFRPEDFVEFKTTKEMQHERQRINFARFKLIKWWCQSFLVGIPSIICGYRDNNGFVGSVKELELKGIPKMTGVDWRPNVCMGFLKNFFYALKQGLIDTPNVVYNVSCEAPGCDIRVIQTDLDMSHVLPTWYTA